MPKDFISFLDWSSDDLRDLVKAAQTFRQLWVRGKSRPALKGRRIALMWGAAGSPEPSCVRVRHSRTRW